MPRVGLAIVVGEFWASKGAETVAEGAETAPLHGESSCRGGVSPPLSGVSMRFVVACEVPPKGVETASKGAETAPLRGGFCMGVEAA